MNRIQLHRPDIKNNTVSFSWSGDGTGLYSRNGFTIELEKAVEIPERLWLTLLMVCLHSQWVLLNPCRVELPHRLLPREKETWLRLLEIEFDTMQAYRDKPAKIFQLELVEGDVELPPPHSISLSERCATAFSGGRDSLVQAGILRELSDRPLLVTTTSPMPPMRDHENVRRKKVFAEIANMPAFEFVDVQSDFRSAWNNRYPLDRGYPVSVNEITDTHLYFAMTAAASWLRGISNVYLAAESEVSDSGSVNGKTILFHHFMYSIPVQAGLSLLLKPWGIQYGSLTGPLRGPAVQSLLTRRYKDLARLQFSCWKVDENTAACSKCSKCLLMGLGILADGENPEKIGVDLCVMLQAASKYKSRYNVPPRDDDLPRERVTYEHEMNILRYIATVSVLSIVRHSPGLLFSSRGRGSLHAYINAQKKARKMHIPRASGWRAAYCGFIGRPLCEKLEAIYNKMFDVEPIESYRMDLEANESLVKILKETE